MTIFAVSPIHQEGLIAQLCFGECGQILVGGLRDDDIPFLPCRQVVCPYEDKTLSWGIVKTEAGQEEVVLRKLKGKG